MVADEFLHMIDECNDFYSWSEEDVDQYDVGWAPLKNESLYFPPFTFKAWEYYSALELETVPVMGKKITFCPGFPPGVMYRAKNDGRSTDMMSGQIYDLTGQLFL